MQSTHDTTPSTLPARLPKGFVVGGYTVDRWVRDGGMAAIYRAYRASHAPRVALKLQLPSSANDPLMCERFDREAEVMRRAAGRRHVLGLLDAGVLDDGRRYLLMEWIEGENLDELLDALRNEDQRLSIARACRICRDVARGLAELHGLDVIHLDVKPANIMVRPGADGRDEIELVDFGIAADLREGATPIDYVPSSAVLGTSAYMAPERVQGHAPDPSFDVYALGVVLFESISGSCAPPHGWTPTALPRLETLRHGVPQVLADLVVACMDADPQRRPASARLVATALEEIIRALETGERGVVARPNEPLVRSGGTEVVPRSRVREGDERPVEPAETDGTEVALTPEPPPRARRRWVALGGAASLLVAGAWMIHGQGGRAAAVSGPQASMPTSHLAALHDRAGGTNEAGPGRAVVEHDGSASASPREPEVGPEGKAGVASAAAASRRDPCRAKRAEAGHAKRERKWRDVLRLTAPSSCWATGERRLQRKRLRVEAWAELHEYGRCVDEGGDSRDDVLRKRSKYCRTKLGGG